MALPRAMKIFAITCFALACSYRPLIDLGMSSTAHLELSLAMIACILFGIVSLPHIITLRTSLLRRRWLIVFGSYALYAGASLLYSRNTSRGVALWAMIILLYAITTAIVAWRTELSRYRTVLMSFAATGVIASCIFAWFQIIGDTFGISTQLTLLPAVYGSQVFGFARPTAWFAEPQFFANFLVIPIIYLSWRWLVTGHISRFELVTYGLAWTSLLATLSRGGYAAVVIGLFILITAYRPSFQQLARIASTLLLTVVVTIGVVFSLAEYNQRDSLDGYQSLQKSVRQMSLGSVDLPDVPATPRAVPATESNRDSQFVSSSTTDRETMAQAALRVWAEDTPTMLFGVGLGGFGAAIHAYDPQYGIGSVVNNQYLETLSELGIVGLSLLIACVLTPLSALYRRKWWLGIALILALVSQWNFFSGYPNVIHSWIVIATCYSLVHTNGQPPRIIRHNRVS